MKRKLLQPTGFSMIEVMIAVMVVGMVMTAVAALMTSSTKLTAESRYAGFARSKVQEALEVFRRERFLLGWNDFYNSLANGVYCYNQIPMDSDAFKARAVGGCSDTFEGAGQAFKREVLVIKTGDSVEVTSHIEWQDATKTREISAEQIFKEY